MREERPSYLAGLVLAAAVTLILGALTQVPYSSAAGEEALIRLAWKNRSVRIEDCRKLAQEEILALPIHMRREEECTGRLLSYRLHVELDGAKLTEKEIHPSGARGDRPIYVYEEHPVKPGEHRLLVEFERESSAQAPPNATPDASSPASLRMDVKLRIQPREILLVTYDPQAESFVLEGLAP